MKKPIIIASLLMAVALARSQENPPPVRLAIVGLVHDHVTGMLPVLAKRQDVRLVGIVEPNRDAVDSYAGRFHLDRSLFYPSIEALVASVKVDAVATFTSTFDHRRVVEACAPLGIDVMMEKPLAVNMEHARAIADAAVHVRKEIGELRKLVICDGHQGPVAIGCSPLFASWLLDPVLNGGGALTDFGCYGVDLATWMMGGQRPDSVFAVTQNFQPDVYPRVDDEATIVLT